MSVPVSAIIVAYRRMPETLDTIARITACIPPPAEIIVHVDGDQRQLLDVCKSRFPDVCYILTEGNLGPGGGRNKLLAAASHDLVASFDDDSFPLDGDYFGRVVEVARAFPEAAIIAASITHIGEESNQACQNATWVADFIGCGCIYRRQKFLETTGYVPLPMAYGMEEVDLALRMHALGHQILTTSWLRIFHNTDLKRHSDPKVTAGSIANILLLAFLRYPIALWPVGIIQTMNRIAWLIRRGRFKGILSGVFQSPIHLFRYRHYRSTISRFSVIAYLSLRRKPVRARWPNPT